MLSDREIVEVAFSLPHKGHNGVPGAPEGVHCPRCESDRALGRLVTERDAALLRVEQAERGLEAEKRRADLLEQYVTDEFIEWADEVSVHLDTKTGLAQAEQALQRIIRLSDGDAQREKLIASIARAVLSSGGGGGDG
jgi:hypothetical protein